MTDDAPRVEVYYSYRSPYSYLAIGRLKRWAEGCDAKLEIKITTKAGVEHVF